MQLADFEKVSALTYFVVKGALDNISKYHFWLNFIYYIKVIANLQIQKKNIQNFF